MHHRTALLIRCSVEEAAIIREQAKLERRTIGSYVLNIVSRALRFEESLFSNSRYLELHRRFYGAPTRPPGPRTAVLVRCSIEEASQIREAAERRSATISGYVLYSLSRSWIVKEKMTAFASRGRTRLSQ